MIGGAARFLGFSVSSQLTANIEMSVDAALLFQLDKKGTEKNKGTVSLGIRPSFAWDPLSDLYRATLFFRYYYNLERVSPLLRPPLSPYSASVKIIASSK